MVDRTQICGATAALVSLASGVLAQTAPPPNPAPSQTPASSAQRRDRPPTTALPAGTGIGATYGTSNLSSGTAATVAPRNPQSTRNYKALIIAPGALLDAQNRRQQPPISVSAYTLYAHQDALLRSLDKLKTSPGLDPTLPILLAWNHVTLDMTSIDHTTQGVRVPVAGAPGGELPVFESTYGEQFGPPRASRAMAIVHLAIFEAVNALDPVYDSYHAPGMGSDLKSQILARVAAPGPLNVRTASVSQAISDAAFNTLVALYPRKRALLEASNLQISTLLGAIEQVNGRTAAEQRRALGKRVGEVAAAIVLDARKSDNSDKRDASSRCGEIYPGQPPSTYVPEPLCYEGFFPAGPVAQPQDPFTWTIDPILPNPLKLGLNWGEVAPFVIDPAALITAAGIVPGSGQLIPVPKANDIRFQEALDQGSYGSNRPDPHVINAPPIRSKYGVRRYGAFNPPDNDTLTYPEGSGAREATLGDRTPELTTAAQFWGYDATALLCAPPRLYNMVATSYYLDHLPAAPDPHSAVKAARYLALVNLALADAGITAWRGKFQYNRARPVTYIRDHLPAPQTDARWTPLGQVASNGTAANTTPPFPAYPSGHAVFGGAVFQMMANFYGVDPASASTAFDFVSDEYNGYTYGYNGKPRAYRKVHFVSLDAARWENSESRIWLGVHWQQDGDDGVALGDAIANQIFANALKPTP